MKITNKIFNMKSNMIDDGDKQTSLRGLYGRGNFYMILISLRRNAQTKNIGKFPK